MRALIKILITRRAPFHDRPPLISLNRLFGFFDDATVSFIDSNFIGSDAIASAFSRQHNRTNALICNPIDAAAFLMSMTSFSLAKRAERINSSAGLICVSVWAKGRLIGLYTSVNRSEPLDDSRVRE